ncbi:MAG: glyceraldehyde-3-phosphate dehydrogenase [Gammaproteobacteria bacterium]|nr:glyceraldehyde-3-phosphate dehydrogenase [Gammaproteobacteria bacterium]
MGRELSKQHLADWNERQALAEKMIPLIGSLYRGPSVVLRVFGNKVMNASTIAIVKAHRDGKLIVGEQLDMNCSYEMLQLIEKMDLRQCRLDLGKLCHQFLTQSKYDDMQEFLDQRLAQLLGDKPEVEPESHDVVLYGFGRIGRILARLLIDRTGTGGKLRLRGVVVRAKGDEVHDLLKRAELLRRDSIHGEFDGYIQVDNERRAIIANGNYIQFIYASSPSEIDYTQYGIKDALVVDNTGIWKDEAGLGQHLAAKGVAKAMLTAPAQGDIKNIVYGINDHLIEASDTILCAASCTTNAIVPPLKVMNDKYGIVSGHVETIHSYTNDQNLIDNFHSKERRGRSAPLNMVITSTGAAKAVAKVLPELAGTLTGNAIRVPTPNVSMAVMNLNLATEVTAEALNEMFQNIAYDSPLQEQIGFTYSTEVVSTDLVGSTHAGVVDGGATIADGTRVVLYVWYDNEAGYSNQVVRMMQKVVGLSMEGLSA